MKTTLNYIQIVFDVDTKQIVLKSSLKIKYKVKWSGGGAGHTAQFLSHTYNELFKIIA